MRHSVANVHDTLVPIHRPCRHRRGPAANMSVGAIVIPVDVENIERFQCPATSMATRLSLDIASPRPGIGLFLRAGISPVKKRQLEWAADLIRFKIRHYPA